MLSGNNRVRDDVLDASLDEYIAPSLGGVVRGNEHKIYTDPEEFFKRTLITESMINLLENIANVASEGRGNKVIELSAFFGGGKTHTLIALYHVIRNPDALNVVMQRQGEPESVKKRVRDVIEKLRKVKDEVSVIVIDGSLSALSPSPINPLKVGAYEVNTLWGYIAHALGRYDDFKRFDQTLAPPQVDDIANLLSHRRLVIIIDEIAQYIESLYNANDDKLKNYAKNVVFLFERLAKAIAALTNVVLVISLPVRFGSGGVEAQRIYKSSDVLHSLAGAIGRVSAAPLEPVKPNEISVLLRIRLFDEIDHARAKEVAEILKQEYDGNKNVFGQVDPKLITRVRETYPFHPLYIDTLLDILDKHEGLQKTRDLLRISRKVMRAIINDKQNVYDLIMPWHIDVEMDDIRNLLLTPSYEPFRLPIEEDIIKRCNNYVKPWIAKTAAKALFIKTFIYGGGIAAKAEFFPTPEELAVLTYEPGLFNSKDVQPKDIAEVVDWITNNLLYVLKDEKTQRLWFTAMMSPVKIIEEYAQKVPDAEAYKKILEAVDDLLKEPLENIIGKKRKKDEIKVFDVEESKVSRECKPIGHDAKKYIVYACLELDVTRKNEILQEVIYNTSSGGMRKYANTIYVVYPEQRGDLLPAINYAKKTMACEKASREEDLVSSLVKGISGQELEIARAVYRSKIDSYCSNATQSFYYSVISALSKLAYPVQKDTARNIVEVDIHTKTTSIIFAVEQALSREGLKKVRLDLDFDALEFLLRSISVYLNDLNSVTRKVSDIIDYFYSNPKLPAVPEKAIRDAIADGVRKLEIGLRCDNKVYYKDVAACESEEECLEAIKVEGEPITDKAVADTCEVLPYAEAVKAQMERLERREWYEDKAKVVEDYYVVLDGKLVSVRDVVASFDEYVNEYGPDTLKEAPLVSVRRRVTVDVEPKEQELKVKPGEEIQHKLAIKRSGPFKGKLHVKADYGEVNPTVLDVDENFTDGLVTWTIKAPTEPGKYSYVLELATENGERVASANLSVVVELGTVEREWYEGVPPEGTEIEDMKLVIEVRDLKPLSVLWNRLGASVIAKNVNLRLSAKTIENIESKINLEISDAKLDDLLAILTTIIGRFGLAEITMSIGLEIVPIDGRSFKMPALSEEELSILSKHKVVYKPVKK